MSIFNVPADATGVRCPKCGGGDSTVKDSRATWYAVRRRRMCIKCQHRVTTYESITEEEGGDYTRMAELWRHLSRLPEDRRNAVERLIFVLGNEEPT